MTSTFFSRKRLLNSSILLKALIITTIALGFHARLTSTLYTVVDVPIRADAQDYFFYALNLNESNIYSRQNSFLTDEAQIRPDALRSPGFPLFASVFIDPLEPFESVKFVLRAQTVLQVFAFLYLLFVMYRKFNEITVLVAALLLFTFPHFISINQYFLTESLFTSLIAIFIAILLGGVDEVGNHTRWVLAGLTIGFAALVRPTVEYFGFFILLYFFLFNRNALKNVFYFFLASLGPILAWKVRNILAIGEAADSTLTINGLYHGSFPGMMFNDLPESYGRPYAYDGIEDEVYSGIGFVLNLILLKFQTAFIKMSSWYLFGKQVMLLQWEIIAGYGDIYIYPVVNAPFEKLSELRLLKAFHKFIHDFWVYGSYLFTWVMVLLNALKKRSDSFLWQAVFLFIIYAGIIHSVTAPFPRYGIPFKVPLIVSLLYIVEKFMSKEFRWSKLIHK